MGAVQSPVLAPAGMKTLDVSTTVQATTLVTTAETLVYASILPLPVTAAMVPLITGLTIVLIGLINAGTGCTGITVRCRRGFGLGGQIDGEAQHIAVTPGVVSSFSCLFPVSIAWLVPPPGGQYSITLQQENATGNASIPASATGTGVLYLTAD